MAGTVGRVNEDGRVFTYLPVNPGNSGGPVVDARGELVGLISLGANTRRGVQGIAILEPPIAVRNAVAIAAPRGVASPSEFIEENRSAAALAWRVAIATDEESALVDAETTAWIERAGRGLPTHEAGMILGLYAWQAHISVLEFHRREQIADLPPSIRELATRLRQLATTILRQVLRDAPFLAVRYSVAHAVLAQRDSSVVVRSVDARVF